MQNSLQYSDGRVEIVDVPKAFSVGDMVAVTHRRDGGVVVQRVGTISIPSGLFTMLTAFAPGTTPQLRIRASITKYSVGYGASTIQMTLRGGGGTEPAYVYVLKSASELTLNTPETITTADLSVSDDSGILVVFDISAGCYVIIDNVQFSADSGSTWFYVTDGNFVNGEFKTDMYEGWVKIDEINFTAIMIDEACKSQDLA